jgi:hypothetical protein
MLVQVLKQRQEMLIMLKSQEIISEEDEITIAQLEKWFEEFYKSE